jgi:hypothetical protein
MPNTAIVIDTESLLGKSLSITARKWLSKGPVEAPQLELKAIIPPDVKPSIQCVFRQQLFVNLIKLQLACAQMIFR